MEEIIKKSKEDCKHKEASIFNKLSNNLIVIDSYLQKSICSLENKVIYVAFNGGKDSIAAYLALKFYLFLFENNKDFKDKNQFTFFCNNESNIKLKTKVKFIYFNNKDSFQEEDDYYLSTVNRENVKSLIINSDYKSGLFYATKYENLEFIIMGVRKDDITHNTNQILNEKELVHISDSGYPEFIRLYPIFDFDYYDIWGLILLCKFPYPKLYDNGYSSLGRKSKTFLNENLKLTVNNENIYLPAYCLNKIGTEREYRII